MDRIISLGRRKTSVARCFVNSAKSAGNGALTINKRSMEDYFPLEFLRQKALLPFQIVGLNASDFDIKINVSGGGITGQAEAIRLGLARAIVEMDAEHKSALRTEGVMTRDPRMVERKKYGQPKARKKTQFSKR